jgi:predicted ATPase/DNA-binding CsgD family transcriptional regulator
MVTAVERSAVTEAAVSMHGFPPALTSFVGRAGVVDELAGHLGQYRLVTVTGPGGAGKTRLAAEVAGRVAGRFADGVWLAELAAVRDPAQVALAVAAALGIRELPSVAAADALAHALARRQLLLVLDNCEHVIGAAAELCGRLLLGADDVRVLATSREPLQITGEARYRLGPLTLPRPDNPADAHGSEAVALFTDRARQADTSFALDDETAPVVARLVARLDGMPLAIELAAARVEALGVAQLLDRIGDRFTLLEAGDRLAAPRQRSLAATVEWSYRLLDEREQRMFRAVSAFPGPFTLEGAEAVAGAGAGPAVLHLVDCSLLVPPRAGPDGRSRYVMLETLRAYGAALLAEAGEDDAIAAALAGYTLQVAEDATAGLAADTGEAAAARWLDAEDATMRQVLEWSMERDTAVALRLAAGLAWWWQIRGRLTAQVPLLRAAVDGAAAGSDAWCTGHIWLGQASLDSADPAGALHHFTSVRDAFGDRNPSPLLARCLSGRSATLLGMGRIAEAAGDARRSLALARDCDHPVAEALALAVLSLVACVGGDRVGAVELARKAERISAGLHGPTGRMCGHTLTTVLIEVGDVAAAERTCAAALAGARDAGDLWSLGNLLEKRVVLDLVSDRYADAALHLREALQTALRTGARRRVIEDLDCCGYLCAMTGRCAEAVTVWAAVVALGREGFSVPLHPDLPEGWLQRQEPLREARQALGPAHTQAAEERGKAMSLATAAEYVLMLTAEGPDVPVAAPGVEGLSPRERELVTLVARGHTDAQIAAQMYISVRTVGSHLDRIRDKTGCRRRADLTRLALSAGLVLRGRGLTQRAWPGSRSLRGDVGDSTPAMAARQEGGNDPCRGRGGRANLWLRAGKPASSQQIGQDNDRTIYPRGNAGHDDRPDVPARTAPGCVVPDPFHRSGDELRHPAGHRAAGTVDR